MADEARPIDVFRRAVELADGQGAFAMATILSTEGSTPRKAGVRAIIDASGEIFGTIGGGAVEIDAQRRAVAACEAGLPVVYDFELLSASPADEEPICGGSVRILIDPTASKDATPYARAAEALSRHGRGVLVTTISGADAVEVATRWYDEQAVEADVGFPGAEQVRSCLAKEVPRLLRQEPQPGVEAFVEPVLPAPDLLIAGAGHIGRALARQAVELGFDVTVLDDRAEFADAALLPEGVRTRCGDVAAELAAAPIGADTYVVIVTRGHRHDAEALAACIHSPAAYVGMIGSRRKVALIRQDFLEAGRATQDELDRVFAPIGLDIGAVTVPEIATSIAAQLIAVRRKAGGDAARPKAGAP